MDYNIKVFANSNCTKFLKGIEDVTLRYICAHRKLNVTTKYTFMAKSMEMPCNGYGRGLPTPA